MVHLSIKNAFIATHRSYNIHMNTQKFCKHCHSDICVNNLVCKACYDLHLDCFSQEAKSVKDEHAKVILIQKEKIDKYLSTLERQETLKIQLEILKRRRITLESHRESLRVVQAQVAGNIVAQKNLNSSLRQIMKDQENASMNPQKVRIIENKQRINTLGTKIQKMQSRMMERTLILYDSISSYPNLGFLSEETEEMQFDYIDADIESTNNATVIIAGVGMSYDEPKLANVTEYYLKLKKNLTVPQKDTTEQYSHNFRQALLASIMVVYRIQQCLKITLPYPIYIDKYGLPQLTQTLLYEKHESKIIFQDINLTRLYLNIRYISTCHFHQICTPYFNLARLIDICQCKIASNFIENRAGEQLEKAEQEIVQMQSASIKENKFSLSINHELNGRKDNEDDDFIIIH